MHFTKKDSAGGFSGDFRQEQLLLIFRERFLKVFIKINNTIRAIIAEAETEAVIPAKEIQKERRRKFLALEGKMEKFCEEYIADYNPIRAAIRAGYAPSSARAYSYSLLKKEKVVSRICELQEEYIKKGLLDNKNRVIRELWEMYERAVQAKPVTVWDKESKEYVETGEYQFDDKIAMKCLEFIAKIGGMLSEKESEKPQKKDSFEIIVKVDSDED